jgi:hypothetical protein
MMPFLRYHLSQDDICSKTGEGWHLFGYNSGLIYKAVKSELESKKDFAWTRTADELLRAGEYDPLDTALIIDLTPRRDEFLVGRVCGAAGFTNREWTPFALMPKVLTCNSKEKIYFVNADRACTILYAHGGWNRGHDSNWTRAGGQGIIAAILWERAFLHIAAVGKQWIENGLL